jgi:hypothetical protein
MLIWKNGWQVACVAGWASKQHSHLNETESFCIFSAKNCFSNLHTNVRLFSKNRRVTCFHCMVISLAWWLLCPYSLCPSQWEMASSLFVCNWWNLTLLFPSEFTCMCCAFVLLLTFFSTFDVTVRDAVGACYQDPKRWFDPLDMFSVYSFNHEMDPSDQV